MTRIDLDQSNAELEKKIKRMESKLSDSRNKVYGCLNFLIYFLIIAVVVIGYVSFVLAKSGVVDVPVLSEKYYNEPLPITKVDMQDYEPINLLEEILQQTKSSFNKGEQTAFARILLDDRYLTYTLQSIAKKHIQSIEEIQAVVNMNSIDLFSKSGSYVYTAKIIPLYQDGKIKLKVSELYLGEIKVPSFLGEMLLKASIEGLINQLNELLKTFGQIKDLQINKGAVEVILLINKNAKFLNVF